MHWKREITGCVIVLSCVFGVFSAPYLVVHKSNGSSVRIPIADIRKITFDLGTSGVNREKGIVAFKKIAAVIKTNVLSADIEYSLKKKSAVRIDIFDLQGNVVRCLKTGIEPAGNYKISWDYKHRDNKKVSAGSYIARVLVDGIPFSKCLYLVQ
jgi:hypothetical protein